ncbi:MAG: phospho-N-acetylmuramoyl-pentapeptide-transferase [Armatimonadota bacterium]
MRDLSVMQLVLAPALSLVLVLALGGPMIGWLRRLGAGQRIRDDGPQRHMEKEGTPTMGGVLIVGAAVVSAILGMTVSGFSRTAYEWLTAMPVMVMVLTLTFGGIGLLDDRLKIVRGRSLGLRARQKLALQLLGAAAFYLAILWSVRDGLGYLVAVTPHWPLLSKLAVEGMVWVFAVVWTSNAVNLADGLDGLAAGLCVIAFVGLAVVALLSRLPFPALATLSLSLAAACLGFLWFNRHPARIFMGDVGSLALGAAVAGLAFTVPDGVWILLGVCLVPFIEAGSVVGQVVSYKTTGKRIFRMSPIHHHFELMGWSEQKVVYTFWAVGAAAAAVTVWLFVR